MHRWAVGMSLPCLKPAVNRTHCGRLGTCSCQKAASNAGKPARVDVCVTGLVEQHGSVPQGLHFEAEISCSFANQVRGCHARTSTCLWTSRAPDWWLGEGMANKHYFFLGLICQTCVIVCFNLPGTLPWHITRERSPLVFLSWCNIFLVLGLCRQGLIVNWGYPMRNCAWHEAG